MDLKQIKELIDKVNETELAEIKISQGDFSLCIRSQSYLEAIKAGKQTVSAPVMQMPQAAAYQAPAPAAPASNNVAASGNDAPAEEDDSVNLITVKAPMIGTFYRSPGPEKGPFIKVGDDIKIGDTICIIEAMKLFNEIEAEVSGKVIKILIEDASPVEYDQPILLIEPA